VLLVLVFLSGLLIILIRTGWEDLEYTFLKQGLDQTVAMSPVAIGMLVALQVVQALLLGFRRSHLDNGR
jgi:hypothetical protein